MHPIRRSSLFATLLILAAAGCGDPSPSEETQTSDDDTVPAPHGPCFCDVDMDGSQDAATCTAEQECGVVCPVGAVDCPPGAEQGAALCYTPCAEDLPGCDCRPFDPPTRGGYCFVPAACGG